MANEGVVTGVMLKRVQPIIRVEHFDRFSRLSRIDKAQTIERIDEIGIECAGALPKTNYLSLNLTRG
jgi:hypothetical protein